MIVTTVRARTLAAIQIEPRESALNEASAATRTLTAIHDELVEDRHIIGTAGEVKERVAQWEETGVTTLLLSLHSADEVRAMAELLA